MLSESGLSKSFWGDCLASLVHVWNRCPTEAVQDATPYELWYKCKPDVSHIRVWGCTAYVHIQRDKRTPLGPHMEKCIFLGYLMVTRAGNSSTHSQNVLLSLKELTLMRD